VLGAASAIALKEFGVGGLPAEQNNEGDEHVTQEKR
jgi:hypothetical protein